MPCFAIRIHFVTYMVWLRTSNVATSWLGFGKDYGGVGNNRQLKWNLCKSILLLHSSVFHFFVVTLRRICNENEISKTAFESWVSKVRTNGYGSLREIKRRGHPPKDMARPRKKEPQTELEKLQAENLRLRAENALLKKMKALVEEQEARARLNGQKPSTN